MSQYMLNNNTWTNTSTGTLIYPAVTSGSSSISFGTTYIPALMPAPPRPQTPLEWLDAEIERTCAMARG